MYSQYQYYQQQGGGAAVSTHQSALRWNGESWVSGDVASGTYSTYKNHNPPKPTVGSTPLLPPNPVHTYTQYYHQWTARSKAKQTELSRLASTSLDRAQVQSDIDWAKYYADLSSRAAHHFHANPAATTAPFDLPPAPPASVNGVNSGSTAPSYRSESSAPSARNESARSNNSMNHGARSRAKEQDEDSPDSLKRYVHNCLSKCENEEEKKAVMNEVEKLIQKALVDGSLHSTNWDSVALTTAPRKQQPRASSTSLKRHANQPTTNSYYGPSNGNYYGPSNPANEIGGQKQQRSPSADGNYYGQSNTASEVSEQKQRRSPSEDSSNDRSIPDRRRHGKAQDKSSKPQRSPRNYKRSNARSYDDASVTANDGYYGPATPTLSSTNHSFEQQHSESESYYGPGGNKRKREVSPSEEDFIAVPNGKKAKRAAQKKKKNAIVNSSVLDSRAKRFSGPGGIKDAAASNFVENSDRYMGKGFIGGKQIKLDASDYENMTVKGTSEVLEKDFLRLTAPPRAELVRPQPVLEMHVANLKAERQRSNRRDYLWFCSQLKAVRQDCTVQRIRNAFAVDVYETHALIALEEGDLNEYNQCQTQLKDLYVLLKDDEQAIRNCNEFLAYRLLYYVFLTGNKKYDGGSSDLFKFMLSLTNEQRQAPAIQHALKVRAAWSDVDYHTFFRLRATCPNSGIHLVDRIVPKMRYLALQGMCKAYRPSVDVEFVLRELGFGKEDEEFGRTYLGSCGCVLSEDGLTWKTKDSTVRESDLEEKKSLI